MRLIHAVRDVNAAGDGRIETVALHTANEARAMFVREADLSYDLGPAAARPYLDLAVLEREPRTARSRKALFPEVSEGDFAHCDREPWRGGDAPDPRREGHQRSR